MLDRRQQQDRRAASDRRRRNRRRRSDPRVFAIELTEQELRLAQLERATAAGGVDRVSAWTTRWRQDAAALESPEGVAELSAALRGAARRHNMFAAEVRIVLSGEFCVTRTVRGTLEEVRHELKQLEQRSRLYLSLGPGEKALATHTHLLDARHAHGLAAACNQETLKAIQTAAENAGLHASMIEPALSALARASCRLLDAPAEPYLLLQLSESSTEIGICHGGQLLLDYRPGGASDVTQLPSLLAGHLNRLNRHVARSLRTSTGELELALLCGDQAIVQQALQQFGPCSPLAVRAVRSADIRATWLLDDRAIEEATAPALGSLLLSYLPAGEIDAPNFMQHVCAGRQERLRFRVLASRTPLAAALLVALAVAGVYLHNRADMEASRADVDSLATAPSNLGPRVAASTNEPETAAETPFEPPFSDRLDLFLPPKREGGSVAAAGASDSAVELVGFVKFDRLRALLSVNGQITPMAEGDAQFGIEVISVQPPNVVLQRGRQRWQASLE